MDPYRWKYRLSRTGEFLICLALLMAWGMIAQNCLHYDYSLRGSCNNSGTPGSRRLGAEALKDGLKWEPKWTMTSPRGIATRHDGIASFNEGVKPRGYRSAMTRVVSHFRFDTLQADGDIHPHPGPKTPTTTPSFPPPTPADQSSTSEVSSHLYDLPPFMVHVRGSKQPTNQRATTLLLHRLQLQVHS